VRYCCFTVCRRRYHIKASAAIAPRTTNVAATAIPTIGPVPRPVELFTAEAVLEGGDDEAVCDAIEGCKVGEGDANVELLVVDETVGTDSRYYSH
jgi:hypothetical protein